ncbi:uncharacterized protein C20orf204 homolog [Sylvia atricapilla]|uniref:uncharacterized protein C20orf204 homolog n=1 Tax=Sylvia atricapilla TaxID=48155 RepID=UPI0033953BCF
MSMSCGETGKMSYKFHPCSRGVGASFWGCYLFGLRCGCCWWGPGSSYLQLLSKEPSTSLSAPLGVWHLRFSGLEMTQSGDPVEPCWGRELRDEPHRLTQVPGIALCQEATGWHGRELCVCHGQRCRAEAGAASQGLCSKGGWLIWEDALWERRQLRLPHHTLHVQIFPRVLSCAVLLLLLVAVLSRGRRCSIAKILRQYRAVIFHEIQNLRNLTGSVYRSGRAGPACRSDKDQRILLSIYNISMSLQEVGAGTLQGPEELAVWKVARTTNFVFRENCRKISKSSPHSGPAQPRRGAPGRRRKQLREIGRRAERLTTCWEKLNALHAARQAPWDS